MSRSCTRCGGNQRLRPLWSHDTTICFEHCPEQYDFCRHCVKDLNECRYCGDAVGISAEMVRDPACDCNFQACHDPGKDCYHREWDRVSDDAFGKDYHIHQWNAENAEDAEDDDSGDEEGEFDGGEDEASAEYITCVDCHENVEAAHVVTWRFDNRNYCVECFKSYY